ncbi:type IV secretory system conjugative DNA transfer family protein [Serinibacter salmoneus]|uniref:Type IV secretion system protein VirD4 n=1 Tax=Serinibacter salmoneus TaxID=556530 RepID=A0A2A9D2V3_9MICO|nr:type IV secretory system conjugative DNA transfer family protein [Serinibacter salmoneus]PFG20711.1 type IV secretion system protein VirD4 [Serinibacter salmoneus]
MRLRNTPRPAPRQALTSPYVGILLEDQDPNDFGINSGRRAGELALGGPHTLLVGGTGQGKGRRVLMQNILMWGGNPVVAMSTSGDLAEGTIRKRAARGPVYLLDLSGEVREEELQGIGVTRVISDPCALVTNDDEAKMMADLLLATGDGGGDGDSIWKQLASRPLAALLRAGGVLPHAETGEDVWGGGINWVLRALDRVTAMEGEEDDLSAPSWDSAYLRAYGLLDCRHAGSLRAAQGMDPRQRDSVAINIRSALDPWTLSTVAGDGFVAPFLPAMLEQPGATLYVVSPMDGSAAGAATAVIEQAIQHWRQRIGQLPTLGLFLDEVANCAPLPKLASHIAVLRKYRVRLVAAVQTVIQLKRVWGEVGMEEMTRTFPSVLLLPATPDREALDLAAWAAGESERSTSSIDAQGRVSRSSEKNERFGSAELLPTRKGTARLLISGGPGVMVSLPDIAETDLQD